MGENFEDTEQRLELAYRRGEITKHDAELGQLRSALRLDWLMQDSHARISPRAYNELKQFKFQAERESKRHSEKQVRKDGRLKGQVFNEAMRSSLLRLNNLDLVREIGGPLCSGKEAAVHWALRGDYCGPEKRPVQSLSSSKGSACVLKLFRPSKTRKSPGKSEMQHLSKLRARGVRCPEPYYCTGSLVVMQFLGHQCESSPQLRMINLGEKTMQLLFEDLVDQMKAMFSAGLVHGDLSEYNLLYHEKQLWIIDLSQAVGIEDARADELLQQDCENVIRHFGRSIDVPEPAELFLLVKNGTR